MLTLTEKQPDDARKAIEVAIDGKITGESFMNRSRTTSNHVGVTLEDFAWGAELWTIDLHVAFTIIPGEPVVMYDRDGGGYPGSGPELDGVTLTVASATAYDADGNDRQPTPEEMAALKVELNRRYDALEDVTVRDAIDAACIDAGASGDEGDDGDERYERSRDERDERRYAACDD